MATCKIRDKEYPLWKVIGIAVSIFVSICASGWGVSQAVLTVEDRWNQEDKCLDNEKEIEEVKLDVAANRKALMTQSASKECSDWSQILISLEVQLDKDPHNQKLKDSWIKAKKKQKETCEEWERLRSAK